MENKLREIDRLKAIEIATSSDFAELMTCKLYMNDGRDKDTYTQEEAQELLKIVLDCYHISHGGVSSCCKGKHIDKVDDYLKTNTDKGTGIVTEGGIKPIWNHRVICKWDGCVDYSTYSNGYGYDHECNDNCQCCQDYIHICDLEKHIEEMQEILKKAKEHYGEDWGNL